MNPDIDVILRLFLAAFIGIVLGLERDLHGKPIGMRTLGLVAVGTALITITALHYPPVPRSVEATSRVLQGIIPGVLSGIGFLCAGVVLRHPDKNKIEGLTTAATVWVTAILGVATALAAWTMVGVALFIIAVVLVGLHRLEKIMALKSKDHCE